MEDIDKRVERIFEALGKPDNINMERLRRYAEQKPLDYEKIKKFKGRIPRELHNGK